LTTPLVRTIRLVASVALIAAVIFVYFRVMAANTTTTVALTLLLAILGIATQWGLTESIVASIAAALGFNYFFFPPVGTFTISDTQNWVAFGAFLVTAITASQLSVRAKRRTAEAISRRREVERLYALGQAMLLSGKCPQHRSGRGQQHYSHIRNPAVVFFSKAHNEFFRSDTQTQTISDELLRGIADRGEPLIDRERQIAVIPIGLGGLAIGSLGFVGSTLSAEALNALAYLVAIGIERARSLEQASKVEGARQSEVLKATLLDALAHDLKTPLTSIKGAVTHLITKQRDPEEAELLAIVNEEADRLNRLVVEVLEMARIEAAKLHPDRRRIGSTISSRHR